MTKRIVSDKSERIDKFLSENLSYTRAFVQKLIKSGKVSVNGKIVLKPSVKLRSGDVVEAEEMENKPLEIEKENKPLKILYEDKYLLVIDKPAGLTVHPVGSKNTDTLVNRLLYHVKDLSGIGGVIRPGIVHRLDKDTSGVLIVAKCDEAHQKLSEMLKTHEIDRRYIALVKGVPKPEKGVIDVPMDRKNGTTKMTVSPMGRRAVTHYRVIEKMGNAFSLVAVKLETGRTHQIRVHLSYIGHPVAGDPVYGGGTKDAELRRQFLHAYEISFIHPIIGKRITVYSMLPVELREVLNKVRKKWKKR